jgi:nucleoid-associated protein YgaU
VDGAQTNAAHFDGINGVEPLPASHGPTDSAPGGYLDAGDARSVRMHRVVNGDTLPKLARTYLGDADLYLVIYEANRRVLWSPYILPIGVELRIPE